MINTLCNLHKFLSIEAHDMQAIREQQATPHLTDWDRWAEAEYSRLAPDDASDDGLGELEGLGELDDHDFTLWSGRLGSLGSSGAHESPF